jgi:hypothetical protein
MVMVVMMIMMLSRWERGSSRTRLWLCHCAFRAHGEFRHWRVRQGNAASGTEAVLCPVVGPTGLTDSPTGCLFGRNRGRRRFLRIYLQGKPLNGLQRGGNPLLPGLGVAHVVAKPSEEFVDCRVLLEFPLRDVSLTRVGLS